MGNLDLRSVKAFNVIVLLLLVSFSFQSGVSVLLSPLRALLWSCVVIWTVTLHYTTMMLQLMAPASVYEYLSVHDTTGQ